jgi:predicted ArsR family transcriptional regulator
MMSTSTIKRHLKSLVELGMITVEEQKNVDGGYAANLYTLALDRDFSAAPKRRLPMALDEHEYGARERGGEPTEEQAQELHQTEEYNKRRQAQLKERRKSEHY